MRGRTLAIAALLLLAACEPVTAPTTQPTTTTTTPGAILPPPDISGTETVPRPTDGLPSISYRGYLPSGANFEVGVPGLRREELLMITGTFNASVGGESLVPAGDVRYSRSAEEPAALGYEAGVLRLWARPWLVEVVFDPATAPDLDSPPFGAGVELTLRGGFPLLTLSEPFTWDGTQPEIRYESFVVASGCGDSSIRCSENELIQVISPGSTGGTGLNGFQVEALTVETTTDG